jgi:hypothetical protein
MFMPMRSLVLVLVTLALTLATRGAHADDDAVPWDDCDSCGSRDWILSEPGIGPEVGPLARLELGTAGVALEDAGGGRAITAGFARIRLAIGLGRSVGVRASATAQTVGAIEQPFPYAGSAAAGGAVAVGITRVLGTVPLGKLPIAATLDGELARGPAVRSGLGLRTLAGAGNRSTVAPGLAAAWDFYVGSVRSHARYLRTQDDGSAMGTGAVELGLGASMRINWAGDFWGGAWPLEAWVDYRYRRGLGDRAARERELRGGLDYTPPRWLDRVGVQLIGTGDRMDDGRDARGLAMLVTLQFGKGL